MCIYYTISATKPPKYSVCCCCYCMIIADYGCCVYLLNNLKQKRISILIIHISFSSSPRSTSLKSSSSSIKSSSPSSMSLTSSSSPTIDFPLILVLALINTRILDEMTYNNHKRLIWSNNGKINKFSNQFCISFGIKENFSLICR